MQKEKRKVSMIERVILSAGAMLIVSVSFQSRGVPARCPKAEAISWRNPCMCEFVAIL